MVLQADNGVLYERLEKRGYPPHKVGGGEDLQAGWWRAAQRCSSWCHMHVPWQP